ncbi:MAG: SRPBCC domain-containing protein [Phycisphaerae bacterium]
MTAAASHVAPQAAQVAEYQFEIEIAADRSHVWDAITRQVGQWWLKDFHVLGAGSDVSLEPVAGGKLIETNGDKSLLWYTVLASMPGEMLSLSGQCTSDWGGPLTTLLTLKLSDGPKGTVLQVTDSLFGKVSESHVTSTRSGWSQLFDDGLRAFIEAN